MDEMFPHIHEHQRVQFPEPQDDSGIVAVGGNLSPGMLLSAYEQGIFPWYSPGEPILWWNPPRRAVILPGDLHISRSLRKVLDRGYFSITMNKAFDKVIRACKEIERPGQEGTWITDEMADAYSHLHKLGYAYSFEVWSPEFSVENPAGGLYGIKLGNAFFGESMFSYLSNASKAALVSLYRYMQNPSMVMIDCQIMNPHLGSMGAREISRAEFSALLKTALQSTDWQK